MNFRPYFFQTGLFESRNWVSLLLVLMCVACTQEQDIPIEGYFEISAVGDNYNVPVRIRITNKVKGADTFLWEFPKANKPSSDLPYPQEVVYAVTGEHTIRLRASNADGQQQTFEKTFTAYEELSASFDWEQQGSSFAPLVLTMKNKSRGAAAYQWHFEGGTPEYSSEENPQVVFERGGDFKITLEAINHSHRQKSEKTISVTEPLQVDFEYANEYAHNWQTPVRIFTKNKTKSASQGFRWTAEGSGFRQESTEENPTFLLPTAGEYTLRLTARNDKQTHTIEKTLTVEAGNNLLLFSDVKLGINTAQNIGCFFSSFLGKTLRADEVTAENGNRIDFVYFGQNESFLYNVFLSPDQAQTAVFDPIPMASASIFINKQENTGRELLSAEDFDRLQSGAGLTSIPIESDKNQAPFNSVLIPRVVLFQTADGRKGAVKIKRYVKDSTQSYILTDIKIQKIP